MAQSGYIFSKPFSVHRHVIIDLVGQVELNFKSRCLEPTTDIGEVRNMDCWGILHKESMSPEDAWLAHVHAVADQS